MTFKLNNMVKIRRKEYKNSNVFDETLDRIRYIYDTFDKVVVSFSGGKDSTAVLNMTLQVAKEKNKLPLEVVFFDEEAIHPPTIEYVKRVSERPDIKLNWYCLEFKHRNACSNEEPFWYTWDSTKEDLWVREMPEEAITFHPNFRKGMSFQEFAPFLYGRSDGKIAMLTGIRTQESMRRYQVIARKKNDAFIQARSECSNNQYRAFPIYDWNADDVWLAVQQQGWDYNKTYDIFNQTRLFNNFNGQRVCPPFGEEPIRGLWVYSECFPELWHKMLYRVEGVATAWRYANTELYSNGYKKPDNLTYQEYMNIILDSYDFDSQAEVRSVIQKYISAHKAKTNQPISETEVHPLSGCSWKLLCRVAVRGDFKGRQTTVFQQAAIKKREELGISLEEAKKIYS